VDVVDAALDAAVSRPAQADTLRALAPDRRAGSALAGGVYVAASFPDVPSCGRRCCLPPQSTGRLRPVAGGLLGAVAGAARLPADLLSRLELAWVAEVLAQDLVNEFIHHPSGPEYAPSPDPTWLNRYPGG